MITLTTEQAQQIEEALEDIVRVFEFETGTPVEALATIRAARSQAQEPVAANCPKCKSEISHWSWCPDFVQPVSQKQEPVAWGCRFQDGSINDCICPEEHNRCEGDYNIPLYAAPVSAKREWVDLTDDELKAALEVHQVGLSVRIGRIAIAAFKEKNR